MIPASLQEVVLEVSIAGRDFIYSFDPQADLSYRFIWDGQDSYGRKLVGSHTANIRIGYVYDAVYYEPDEFGRAFARAGSGPITRGTGGSVSARQPITLWQLMQTRIQASSSGKGEFGGWSLSPKHKYEPISQKLTQGDGTVSNQVAVGELIIETVAGVGEQGFSGDGGPAAEARLDNPSSVAFDAEGSLYISDYGNHRIRKIGIDGVITTIAGTGGGYSGDGGNAVNAEFYHPWRLAFGEDDSLYVSSGNDVVRRISSEGIVTTVAGIGSRGMNSDDGEGGPATEIEVRNPGDISVSEDGSVYVIEYGRHRVRRIDQEGNIYTVAGSKTFWPWSFDGDGGPAKETRLYSLGGISYTESGDLYIVESGHYRIRRVDTSGVINTVVGSGSTRYSGDGGQATEAGMWRPGSLAIGADGSLYFATANRIRKVSPNGVITTIAGTGSDSYSGDNGLALEASFSIDQITYGPDGNLYIADYKNHRIRRISKGGGVSADDHLVPSLDGGSLFRFDANGSHLSTRDNVTGGLIYNFRYDDNNLLVRIEGANGNNTIIERNSDGTPVAIVAPDGQRTSLTLDSSGYLAGVTNPAGESYTMAYTEDGLLTRFTDPNQNSSSMTYDELGYLQTDINAEEGGWTLEKESLSQGQEYRMTSAEGRTTRYQVVPQSIGGRLRNTVYPDGTIFTKLFGTGGDVFAIAPDGTETYSKRGPDPRFGMGAPVSENVTVTTPAGLERVITTTRSAELEDEADLLSHTALGQTVDVNGRTTTASYNANARTWQSATPEGRESTIMLNEEGFPLLQQSGGLAALGFNYDGRGRLIRVSTGTGSAQRTVGFSYGSDGFLKGITDTLQRTATFNYDLAGRVTRLTYHDGRSIGYQYDPAGNLTAIIPPGREAHVFNYSKVHLEEGYTPPDLAGVETITSYQYNKDKQLTLIERPDGRRISYGYDGGGRLARRTIARGSYSHAYGVTTGQLKSITAPGGGTLSYEYDGFLPLSESWSGNIAGSVSSNYDNNFWLASQCVNTNNCVDFSYDEDGLLTQAGALNQTRHAQNGLLLNAELGSTATVYGYNSFGELLSAESEASGNTLVDFGYQRDSLGRIGTKTETLNGNTVVESYEYDTVGRLKSVTRNGDTTSWQYDSNGNRTHENGQQIAVYDEQDRLLTYKDTGYSYTANGELKSKTVGSATTSYSYDELGNLISAALPGDLQIEYLIDGRDRRIGKKVNGQLVQGFLYKDQLNPVAELDSVGNVVARFIYGEKKNVPAYMVKGGTSYRIISDHLGSPRVIVNVETGVVAQQLDYDVWGNVVVDTNPGFQPFGFAGGVYDIHTELTRFGVRDYDAKIGRWTTKDPIGFLGGSTNLYAYVQNDPVNLTDPSGKIIFSVAGAIVGAVASGAMAALEGESPSSIMKQAAIGALTGAFNPTSAILRGALALAGEAASQAVSDDFNCKGFNSASLLTAGLLGPRGGHPEAGTPFREALNDIAPGEFIETQVTTFAGEL